MFYYLFMVLLLATSVFLIVLVLIQKGKGGGLAGALGGMGGQSAFGTKAGDLFTRITIGLATFWILLCIVSVRYYAATSGGKISNMGGAAETSAPASAPASPDKSSGAVPAAPSEGKPLGADTTPAPVKSAK